MYEHLWRRVMEMCWCYVFKTPSSGYCCMVFVRYALWINNIYDLQNASDLYMTLNSTSTFWVWCEHLDAQILTFTLKREPIEKVLNQYVIWCYINLLRSSYDRSIVLQQFYNLVSVTTSETEGSKAVKMTRIKKKKAGSTDVPNITLCDFLKMAKEGIWWSILPVSGCCCALLINIKYGCSPSYPFVCTNKVMTEVWWLHVWEMSYF